MSQKTITTYVDDLDGSEGEDVSTIQFGLDGVSYEADLSQQNAKKLRDDLAGLIEVARKVSGHTGRQTRSRRRSNGAGPVDREQTRAVREWGRANGWTISERGRIPGTVTAAFDAAH